MLVYVHDIFCSVIMQKSIFWDEIKCVEYVAKCGICNKVWHHCFVHKNIRARRDVSNQNKLHYLNAYKKRNPYIEQPPVNPRLLVFVLQLLMLT